MKLFYFRGAHRNFGDDLNLWLWPRVFGDIFDDDERELFVGIGSTMFDTFSATSKKIVFGAGYGGYTPPPDVHDGSWHVYFVRGPKTARRLGLNLSAAITDSAILVNKHYPRTKLRRFETSFVPHWESVGRGRWEEVCRIAGLHFIDPRWPVERVLAEIADSQTVVTEAMHGAIVADALRIPWIAATPISSSNRFKWHDWTESLELRYRPAHLCPSTAREGWTLLTHREAQGRANQIGSTSAVAALEMPLLQAAACRLTQISRREPSLSSDSTFANSLERIEEHVDGFKRDFAAERLFVR